MRKHRPNEKMLCSSFFCALFFCVLNFHEFLDVKKFQGWKTPVNGEFGPERLEENQIHNNYT